MNISTGNEITSTGRQMAAGALATQPLFANMAVGQLLNSRAAFFSTAFAEVTLLPLGHSLGLMWLSRANCLS